MMRLLNLKSLRQRTFKLLTTRPKQITNLVLHGTLFVAICFLILLALYNLTEGALFTYTLALACGAVVYLALGEMLIYYYQRYVIVGWMLVLLYASLAFGIMLTWGINAPVGIIIIGFIIFLTGLMISTRTIVPVTFGVLGLTISIYLVHSHAIMTPDLTVLSHEPNLANIAAYSTLFSIFALVTWVAGRHIDASILRAKAAEQKLRHEKQSLAEKLEAQSAALRIIQQQEIARLYKFAEIGQSTTATLHELANHLSILRLDIEDIDRKHQNSEAIVSAKESINHINQLVRQTRRQLERKQTPKKFNALPVIKTTLQNLEPRIARKSVPIETRGLSSQAIYIFGDQTAFSHALTIFINNAIDAVHGRPTSKVSLTISRTEKHLYISVVDTGPGIPIEIQKKLFKPIQSSKPNGLGVGLYIAHSILRQLKGSVKLVPSENSTHFLIKIPLHTGQAVKP